MYILVWHSGSLFARLFRNEPSMHNKNGHIIKLGPNIESGLHSNLYLPFMYTLSRVFTDGLCSWFGVFALQSDGLIDLNSFLLITRRSADNLLVV